MRLEGWAEYQPPPGSRYMVHYVPDLHSQAPDLNAFARSLDNRANVQVHSVDAEGNAGVVADVTLWAGDQLLLGVLGAYHSDGSDKFWKVAAVDRTDDGVPSGIGIFVGQVLDSLLDPVEDIGSAAKEATGETLAKVARVGIPTVGLVGIAVGAFLLARARF